MTFTYFTNADMFLDAINICWMNKCGLNRVQIRNAKYCYFYVYAADWIFESGLSLFR